MSAPRALDRLLEGLVDYAGLFPPAALAMPEAVARYAAYRAGPHRAMLGRFVVPVARLGELAEAARPEAPWPLAVLADAADAAALDAFAAAHAGRFVPDTVETRAADLPGIWRAAAAFDERFTVFVEIPTAEDPAPLVRELAARGLRAKIRTGGVTPEAFPSPSQVLRFLAECARHGVPLKATAGLHHPLRGEYPLTYAPDSARGTMYGFLNLFLAAALLYDGADEAELEALLEERDPAAIVVEAGALAWRGHRVTTDEIARARAAFAGSFGSCSFEEPLQDLGALHLLPA